MLWTKPQERRKAPRHPTEHMVKIKIGNDVPPLYCLVTDTSDGGVRINLDTNSFHIPDEFVLLLSSREGPTEGKYRVVWRLRHEVGAKLVKRV